MKVFSSVAVTLFVLLASQTEAQKINVQVLFGSLCPDAIRFIQNQLTPLYPHIKDYVGFTFVPFGKARSTRHQNNDVSFACQHGDADCSVSRLQVCAMSFMRTDPDRTMEFIACQMKFGSDRTGRMCANHVGLSFDMVTECYDNMLGELLMLQSEAITNKIQKPLDWVPTITYDWEFNQNLSRRSERNLTEVICEQIRNEAPICRK